MSHAYYDGHAEWYERTFATGEPANAPREAALRLLGPGSGRLLDVGCGTDPGRYTIPPELSPSGLRARVGGVHLPLGNFVQSFLDAGLSIEHFEELERREVPNTLALRCRR